MAEQILVEDGKYEYSSDDDVDDGFTMLTDGGGLQKRTILPGDDDKYMKPPKYARIKCHYIGRLIKTGEQFNTSRIWGKTKKGKIVEPQPFEFILGQNEVIKALDISIGTMKKNEICIIRCSPKYGYGEKGNENGTIPGNAWLEFEIELINWYEWQPIYIGQSIINNLLQKHVIINGYKSYTCQPYDVILLSYKGYIPCINNILFDSKEKITIICDDDIRFPDGFHLALQGMEEGELSLVSIDDYNLGFGIEGDINFNIPYFADIQYEIHIHHIQIAKRVNEYNSLEKIEKAKQYKIEGNNFFGKQSFPEAIKKYNKALEWINYVKSDEYYKDKIQLNVDINNNISLIWMKRGDYQMVIKYAEKVLSFDDKNVKALSRCAAVKIKQNNYVDAKIDLKKAKLIEPNNSYVKKLLQMTIAHMKKEKNKQKKQYHAMFGYRPEKPKKT